MVLYQTHSIGSAKVFVLGRLWCSNKMRNVYIALECHSVYTFQWPYKCLNFNAEKWHFTFNYSRIYPHITHIHILIYFLAHSLGWQVKMYSSLIQHIAKGCLRELMSFSTVCTNTLTHSIRFPPYDSVSLQSYSDLREPKGAAPWVSRPDQ